MHNYSPWLNFERKPWPSLRDNLNCEVAIVGAGISGVATLYYLLTATQKKVVLLEKNSVASGATGHNAGLAVAHIEKSASELAQILGEKTTQDMFKELDAAWEDLHAIHEEIGLKDNLLSPFPHTANGFSSVSQFIAFIKDTLIRHEGYSNFWRYLVRENLKGEIPREIASLVEFVSHEAILTALKTADTSYVAAAMRAKPFKAKRMNSARLCLKILDYLKEKFPGRFSVYENTDITKIKLYEKHSLLQHAHGQIVAQDVILCTNAFKHFSLWDEVKGKPIHKLQESITPRIGYLAAFSCLSLEPYALGFLNENETYRDVPFWYFSNVPHRAHDPNHACVIGGPEFDVDDSHSQEWIEEKKALSLNLMQNFLKTTFQVEVKPFPYFWHGLMGYTPNGLRWTGPDPDYPHLLYNLGCNGIGIVPAISSAKRIAALLSLNNA